MLSLLESWKGRVEINGVEYKNIQEVPESVKNSLTGQVHIKLLVNTENATESHRDAQNGKEYRITVKPYMTKKSTPEFDFMARWNNDVPMPLVTMTGTKEKETKGMVYMKLHGDVIDNAVYCMRCGRLLTNPVSRYFGIGPECGEFIHASVTEEDMEDIKKAVEKMRTKLRAVQWEGWVIRSSILEEKEVR